MKILVVGYGNIGKHVCQEFSKLSPRVFDPLNAEVRSNGVALDEAADIAFVCVPTDKLDGGSADVSIVEEVVRGLSADVIVVKSTVPVGTCERLSAETGKRIVFSPEYYGTTQHAEESPNFVVLGGGMKDSVEVAQLYYKVKNGSFKVRFTSSRMAELAKYMENCFLALKVTFCAEFAQVASLYDLDYEELREIFVLDPRMGNSHTFVDRKKPYYDSHCLNKDIPAFLSFSGEMSPLMSRVHTINESCKEKHQRLSVST